MDRIQREGIQRDMEDSMNMQDGDMTGYDMFRGTEDKAGRIDWGQCGGFNRLKELRFSSAYCVYKIFANKTVSK